METVQQNGRFTLFSSKFLSIYSILYGWNIDPLQIKSVHTRFGDKLPALWPNLKNLSGGLNLSRGLNIVGST